MLRINEMFNRSNPGFNCVLHSCLTAAVTTGPFLLPCARFHILLPGLPYEGYVATGSPKAGEHAVPKKQSYLQPESSD